MTKFKRYLRLPGSLHAEVDDEIAYHIEMKVEQLMSKGWPESQARQEAARQFGDEQQVRSEVRALLTDSRKARLMEELRQDIRFAIRQLFSAPLFALVATLTIGLGIGATTAIFSVVRAVLLRPLPYANADRIVLLGESDNLTEKDARTTTSYLNYEDWKQRARSFEAMAVFDGWSPTLTGQGAAERLAGSRVTSDLFRIFQLQPLLGRAMLPGDNVANGPRIVWISESFWRGRLAADPNVIGKTITLNGNPREIVGVLPRFHAPNSELGEDVWVPTALDDADGRGARYLNVAALLKPGIPIEAARAEMKQITAQLTREYPEQMAGSHALVFPLRDLVVGGTTRGPVLLLMLASAMVLLIACANTSNLLIARGSYRAKEFAIRMALGTGRGRLVRQLLTESVVLASVGTALGLGIALAGLRFLVGLAPQTIRAQNVGIDGAVLLFAIGSAFVAAIAFGLLPALRASTGDLQATLREEGRGSTSARSLRVRGVLAVAQLSLALALLVGAALMLRSFQRVLDIDPGIKGDNFITMTLFVPSSRYTNEEVTRFFEELVARASEVPGVENATVASTIPFSGGWDRITVDTGTTRGVLNAQLPEGDRFMVSPGYFSTMGIGLLEGRYLSSTDRFDAPRVAVVDEVFARKVARHGTALGVRIGVPGSDSAATIVGVVNHVKTYGLDLESGGQIYVSHVQYPWAWMSLIARSDNPMAMVSPLRNLVRTMDPNLAVFDVKPLYEMMAERTAPRRFVLALLGSFAVIALVLASVGLYGVIGYTIAQRQREFGIRLALGATPRSLIRMVMSEGMLLAAIGIPLGIGLTIAGTRLVRSLLFGVTAFDVPSTLLAVGVLGATALLATWIPARRAASVDPLQTMQT